MTYRYFVVLYIVMYHYRMILAAAGTAYYAKDMRQSKASLHVSSEEYWSMHKCPIQSLRVLV